MTNQRFELACKAHEQIATASLQQLMDGLEMRLKTIQKEEGDIQEGARYAAAALLAEIAKRHQINVQIH